MQLLLLLLSSLLLLLLLQHCNYIEQAVLLPGKLIACITLTMHTPEESLVVIRVPSRSIGENVLIVFVRVL